MPVRTLEIDVEHTAKAIGETEAELAKLQIIDLAEEATKFLIGYFKAVRETEGRVGDSMLWIREQLPNLKASIRMVYAVDQMPAVFNEIGTLLRQLILEVAADETKLLDAAKSPPSGMVS